ncbi:MAG: IS66 family insertion sequence element accessory protein TnpB [Verrucomicrobiales bacterium]|nr:IS66 family insertion sequence element accessory protein TnpB [Verrucomicrobiales bacterium]
MLSFSGSLRIYLAVEPCDMRKSFNGLYALAEDKLKVDPRSGAVFVFANKRRNRIKLLYFDGTGLWVMAKRLEQGTFSWPKSSDIGSPRISLAPEALAMLTDGIDLRDGCRRAWFERD